MLNSVTINHPMRPVSLPVSTNIPMPGPGSGPGSVNQNVHIKQTLDRLRCIQKHLKNPALFNRTIRELIDWCSDSRAFRPYFHQPLIECLTVVSNVAGNPSYDLELCYRLLHMCHEQREKFPPSASSMLVGWFRRIQSFMIAKQPPSLVDQQMMAGPHPGPGSFENSMMNSKPNMGHYPLTGQRVSDQVMWNQHAHQQNLPHLNQQPSLSVITTATVWDVSTTQTPPSHVHSSSSASFNSHQMNHPGFQTGNGNTFSNYSNDYTNRPMLNDGYSQHSGNIPSGRMGPHRHSIHQDQTHHSPAAAAAAAAVAAAAAAATATATATATVYKEDPNQLNSYDQMPPSMNGSLHQPGLHPNQHPRPPHHSQSRMRPQMPPDYGRAASAPSSFPASSPRPLSHMPVPSYSNESLKQPGRPQAMSYGSHSFNNDQNPLKTPDIFSQSRNPSPGYSLRPPIHGPGIIASNSYHSSPQQELYPGAGNLRHPLPQQPSSAPPLHNVPSHHNLPQLHNGPHLGETRFCSPHTPVPGNPTPPLTPGSIHNVPSYPGPGIGGINEKSLPNDPFFPSYVPGTPLSSDADDFRLTFPVRDGVVLCPFRLEHNLSVSTHAFHLREHVHKTLFERPDLDLQFKCYHHEDSLKSTNWPHLVKIRVNSTPLPVPRGVDRASHKPFYLKGVCKPGRNVIEIAVSACCCSHLFVLQLVHRPSIPFVLKGLFGKRLLPDQNCKAKIKQNFTNGSVAANDVLVSAPLSGGVVDQMGGMVRVSLFCPITGNRIRIPARGQKCKHIQCFDLESYLQLNRENTPWNCPVCHEVALLELLEVDEYMQIILKKTTRDCHHVSIDANCNWLPLSSPSPSSFPPNQLSRTLSSSTDRNTLYPSRFVKQESHHCGMKQEPGSRKPGFGLNPQEHYISALSIKKEPRQGDIHVKPDPDAPQNKRMKLIASPGANLNNHPSVNPGGCNKMELGPGFPQSQNSLRFSGSHQKSPGPRGSLRSGELMVADMKEYVAANDMVPIEKRLNPAVNQSSMGLSMGNSPKNKPSNYDMTKSTLGPSTPLRPPSNSIALTPQSVGPSNCQASTQNQSNQSTCANGHSSESGDLNSGGTNPDTPVVSELNLDALDSVFDPFFESGIPEKGDAASSSLSLDSLVPIAKNEEDQKTSRVATSSDIMDLLSDFDPDASNPTVPPDSTNSTNSINPPNSMNPTNPDEENILSWFEETS